MSMAMQQRYSNWHFFLRTSQLCETDTPFVLFVQNLPQKGNIHPFSPPASAVEVIKTVPSVCVCVCLSVSALTAEPCVVWSQNLAQGLTLIISWMSSKMKVIGQRSRSPGQKTWFPGFFSFEWTDTKPWHMVWHHVTLCDVTRRHVTSLDVMTS